MVALKEGCIFLNQTALIQFWVCKLLNLWASVSLTVKRGK